MAGEFLAQRASNAEKFIFDDVSVAHLHSDLSISFRVTSLALVLLYDRPGANEMILKKSINEKSEANITTTKQRTAKPCAQIMGCIESGLYVG